jgi:hypothetical protein
MPLPKLTCLLFAALSALGSHALTLEELEKSYEQKLSDVRLEKEKSLADLKESYLGALARIETKYQKAGRLDELMLTREEMKDISEGKWPLTALPEKISLDTAAPRKIYLKKRIEIEQEAARKTTETADKMLALLDKRKVELTKEGDLEQALLADQIKAEIEADTDLAGARKLLANVLSDGQSRPALRIRRFGDNKEVIVRYDMRGKVSMNSPVSNVAEADKAAGDTSAKTLGEFVGAEGYKVDGRVLFKKVFDDTDLGGVLTGADALSQPGETLKGFKGMAFSIKENAVNPTVRIPVDLPIGSSGELIQLTVNYFVPESNTMINGFLFVAGNSNIRRKKFTEIGKWVNESVSFEPDTEEDKLRLYFYYDSKANKAKLHEDKIILGSLKIEQIKFSAFVVQRLGANGVITESYEDPGKQPTFISNGELIP